VTAEPKWISSAAVLAICDRLIAEHGGASGFLDVGKLDSALASPRNHFLHGEKDFFRLAAAYAWAITRDHPFRDGNKRVALTVAGVFLELNGYRLDASENAAVSAMLALSAREIDAESFAEWLRDSSASTQKKVLRGTKKTPRGKAQKPK
jgi:death-on-curing protein